MANISDQSGDERQQRIAELKKKMQDAAKKTQAANAEAESAAPSPAAKSVAAPQSTAPAPVTEAVKEDDVFDEAVADVVDEDSLATVNAERDGAEATPEPTVATQPVIHGAATNGAPVNGGATNGKGHNGYSYASATTASVFTPADAMAAEQLEKRQMNRREFLTYAWGGALGLVALQTGVVSFLFMYPRFKAGEFGGAFFMGPESSLPPADAAPLAEADGKFWWVNVEGEGPKALYMVCTHLGCLYKWVGENNRFECPCHGSKFTREGLYIEGPAPRSLDYFEVSEADGEFIVDTGARVSGAPAADSAAAGTG